MTTYTNHEPTTSRRTAGAPLRVGGRPLLPTYSTDVDGFEVSFHAARRKPWRCTCPAAGQPTKQARALGTLYCIHVSTAIKDLTVEQANRLAISVYNALPQKNKSARHTIEGRGIK